MTKRIVSDPLRSPVLSPAYVTREIVLALKAVASGNASAGQQRDALSWIINNACAALDDCMVPGKPDVSVYFAGRRSVMIQIKHLLDTPLHHIQKETK